MLDMMKMMGKIKEAQEKMKKIKDELDTIELKSESGAGLVSVHINGKKEILSINIDKSILDEKEIIYDNIEIGKILIFEKFPFAIIKFKDKNFNFDQNYKCGNATIKIKKPNWIN